MNRLMKAEWYRVRHTSGVIKWLVIFCLFCTICPILVDVKVCTESLTNNLLAMQESIFVPMLAAVFSAVVVGISYMDKTAYYEVMAGNRMYQIVFSKVLVNASLITVSVFGCMGIYCTIIGVCNGIGEITQLPLRMVLLFLVLFHLSSSGILIVTSVRQLLGAILVYVRFFILEGVIGLIVAGMTAEICLTDEINQILFRLEDWYIMEKLIKILDYRYKITGHLVFTVLVGMVIEIAVWFAVSYRGRKKDL